MALILRNQCIVHSTRILYTILEGNATQPFSISHPNQKLLYYQSQEMLHYPLRIHLHKLTALHIPIC